MATITTTSPPARPPAPSRIKTHCTCGILVLRTAFSCGNGTILLPLFFFFVAAVRGEFQEAPLLEANCFRGLQQADGALSVLSWPPNCLRSSCQRKASGSVFLLRTFDSRCPWIDS